MKTHCLCLTFALCCLIAQAQNPKEQPSPKHVSSAGCTKPGVDAGCIVLEGFKDKKLYNLFFKGRKPDFDTAISFQGVEHQGPTTCMQGLAVNVTKWTPLKMKCPKDASPSKKE
jgi:hypothetical protein